MKISVGKGKNIKFSKDLLATGTERIFSVSFLSCVTCKTGVPCMQDCYSRKVEHRRPAVLESRLRNTLIYQKNPNDFWSQLEGVLKRTRFTPKRVRFFVGGDFIRKEMVGELYKFAFEFPDIGFMAFTKKWEYLKPSSTLPVNLKIRISHWPGDIKDYKEARKLSQLNDTFPFAWMKDKRNPDTRIHKSAVECPGNCSNCNLCWNIKKDVYFNKH